MFGIFCLLLKQKLSEGCFGRVNEFRETGFVVDRDFGKHFAVQRNVRFAEAFNETAVADVIDAAGGVYAYSPQIAEETLFLFAVHVGHCLCAVDRFSSLTEKFTARAVKSFGEVEPVFSAAT